jgi:hypothetical protein
MYRDEVYICLYIVMCVSSTSGLIYGLPIPITCCRICQARLGGKIVVLCG